MATNCRAQNAAIATLVWAALSGACDLSDLNAGEPGGAAFGGAGAGGVSGIGGAGGTGGEGGAPTMCPAVTPFAWMKAIGNAGKQVTYQPDFASAPLSSVRIAAIPTGGFFAALITDDSLSLDRGVPIGGPGPTLFVLRFAGDGSIAAARAHPLALAPDDSVRPLIEDALVRADGALIVAGRIGSSNLVLQTPLSGPLSVVSLRAGSDGFVASFDADGFATDAVRLESTKAGKAATVRGLATIGEEVVAVGGYTHGVTLNDTPCQGLVEDASAPHGFALVFGAGGLGCVRGNAFRATVGAEIELTSVTASADQIFVTADFDLRNTSPPEALYLTSSWVLNGGANPKAYPDQALVMALSQALAPEWVTLVETSAAPVTDHLAAIGYDAAADRLWVVGQNANADPVTAPTTSVQRVFTTAGPSTSPPCSSAFENEGSRALVAALDANGECASAKVFAAASAARATVIALDKAWIAGFAVAGSFDAGDLESYASETVASGFLMTPKGGAMADLFSEGVIFGGSNPVRVDDMAVLDDGSVVVAGSMGAGFLDLACPQAAEDFDFFLASIAAP